MPSLKLPPLAAAVQKNLLTRIGEPFNVSAPNSTRVGVITNCDTDVAYSFDDAPYIWHQELNQLFAQNNAKATFFVNGNNWGCIYSPENVKALQDSYAAGHLIGSHTWGHVHMDEMTPQELDEQMDLIEEALWKILGIVPAVVRPPYGEANAQVVAQLNARGYTVVTWDVDSGDSVGVVAADSIARLQAFKYPQPHMPLNHEMYQSSVDTVAPAMLPYLKKQGYKMLTIAQCLNGVAPYKIVGKPQQRDETWTCGKDHAPPSASR
ncbi:carbohydrate esterase family 4 protein [Tilletiaria anomala UBC 951]|uniref:Carbohydrate esterase family 4 protein n=1 Tax=Tilletiaria anomala (strain ATCC 24038 / CBS 436.72 / UBC 951) TaxID=1037660 RepID=A0A066WAS2_TILAU|nr:carbohydrate esterase family 4 protein [Tilletiaria anomala UBC 951]KDN48189.1 carbohydrate esterase family 4 protein [Tilletiaria anomala UBC 951]